MFAYDYTNGNEESLLHSGSIRHCTSRTLRLISMFWGHACMGDVHNQVFCIMCVQAFWVLTVLWTVQVIDGVEPSFLIHHGKH